MPVRREIQITVRAKRWEHFVTRCVNGCAKILNATSCAAYEANSPNIESSFTTWHIADKVEPVAVWRQGGVCKA